MGGVGSGRKATGVQGEKERSSANQLVIHRLVANNAPLKVRVQLQGADLEALRDFMVEHDFDDVGTAIRTTIIMATTTGSKFSVVQKLKLRAIIWEVRRWLFQRMRDDATKMMNELQDTIGQTDDELQRTLEELAAKEAES